MIWSANHGCTYIPLNFGILTSIIKSLLNKSVFCSASSIKLSFFSSTNHDETDFLFIGSFNVLLIVLHILLQLIYRLLFINIISTSLILPLLNSSLIFSKVRLVSESDMAMGNMFNMDYEGHYRY